MLNERRIGSPEAFDKALLGSVNLWNQIGGPHGITHAHVARAREIQQLRWLLRDRPWTAAEVLEKWQSLKHPTERSAVLAYAPPLDLSAEVFEAAAALLRAGSRDRDAECIVRAGTAELPPEADQQARTAARAVIDTYAALERSRSSAGVEPAATELATAAIDAAVGRVRRLLAAQQEDAMRELQVQAKYTATWSTEHTDLTL